jgi:hypothetical protein
MNKTVRFRWNVVLLSALLMTIAATASVAGQANTQAEARDRIELGRLSEGPAIVGAGLIIGEPTGISAKLWFVETGFGLDAAVAWSFTEPASLYMHGNALFHLALIQTAGGRYIVPYVGAGANTRFGSEASIGVRIPIGLSLLPFPNLPLEFFAELAPGIGLLPSTSPSFGAGLGARFYLPL